MYYLTNTYMLDIKKIKQVLWWIKNEKDFENILKVLFTEKEIIDFSDRIDILKSLKNWNPQREIAKELWVSITTVTRWNRFFKENEKLVKKYIN
jgi:Trp operon repressor